MEWHGYATERWLLVFSWVNHSKSAKIGTEHTLTSESEAATLQTWICLWNTWQHILPSVAKKASTTSTAERWTAAAGEQTHQLSSDGFPESSGRSVFELESCHRLIDLSTAPLSLQYTEMQKDPIRYDKTSGYLWTKFRLVAKEFGSCDHPTVCMNRHTVP